MRVNFAVTRDAGAPEYPLILVVSYPALAIAGPALASPVRTEARAATEAVLTRFFAGRIHHHFTEAEAHEEL